jgi:hypothetical protein
MPMRRLLLLLFCLSILSCSAQTLLTNGHAHNDYWHARPLLDALDNGFMSVEADCFLLDGEIMVAHERASIKKENTLSQLYLEPLMKRARQNDLKSIYANGPEEFVLYIDIKDDCERFIPFLDSVLKGYAPMLTRFAGGKKVSGAVRVLVNHCGNDAYLLHSEPRYLSLSGEKKDVASSIGSDTMPRISFAYPTLLSWRGLGKMPKGQKEKLHSFIQKAHSKGYSVRMWAAGNNPKIWEALVDADVDWINVDELENFKRFMEKRKKQ